jgi:mono/diheme cytochrome c family protein
MLERTLAVSGPVPDTPAPRTPGPREPREAREQQADVSTAETAAPQPQAPSVDWAAMRARTLLLVLPLALAACGGAQKAAPTAETVIGALPTSQPAKGNPVAGKALFTAQCGSCHTFAPAGTSGSVGPNLDKLAADAKNANRGSLQQYTRESIMDPGAYIVPGFQNVMPSSFGQTLKPQQVADLVAFLSGQKPAAGQNTVSTTTGTTTNAAVAPQVPSGKIDPVVAAGAHDFVQFACAQCHGLQGRGGISQFVPALTQVGRQLTAAQLRTIIDHGLGESTNPTRPYMPVWGAVISVRQVNELVAYIRAGLPTVPDAVPVPVPRNQGLAVAGAALYVRDGCINCHGPNGLGGVPNPLSADKTIPPLSGADFRKEFNTDAKIIAVIRSGSVIGRAPIVSMPHWGGIISDNDLEALTAYLKTLK